MLNDTFIFLVALYVVIKSSTMATKYAGRLAGSLRLSEYTIGFIIVAVISILPETFISINSAIAGIPSFGLGTLFGSNIADLTLLFAVIVFYSGRSLKIESKILKNHAVYSFLLLLPLILGLDGYFSRLEGAALIVAGATFYYVAFRKGAGDRSASRGGDHWPRNLFMVLVSMTLLLIGAHFTVVSATSVANSLGVSPILIGMLIVGLGTTMPELFFSLQSIKKKDDSLAIGDLLGTVLADATIVVGILALVDPFAFPQKIIYVTGSFMVIASFVLFRFMRSGHALTRRESFILLAFWAVFVAVEFLAST
jgi:cation:H+ antiporter